MEDLDVFWVSVETCSVTKTIDLKSIEGTYNLKDSCYKRQRNQ